jgi:hypothetical protein
LPPTLKPGVGIEVKLLVLYTLAIHEPAILPRTIKRHIAGEALNESFRLAVDGDTVV